MTVANCGVGRQARLVLCAVDPEAPGAGPNCQNSSCPTANAFNTSGVKAGGAAALLANAYDGRCMEGMLGPVQPRPSCASVCAAPTLNAAGQPRVTPLLR